MNKQETARLKLAGTYLAIIMSMSIIFSFIIYDISEHELTGQRQIPIPQNTRIVILDEFDRLRSVKLEQSRNIIKQRLITFNLITLLLGGGLSYLLARRALLPIEAAFEAKSRFTSDASHEIRTPLTVMRSEIETTLRDKNLNLAEAKNTLASNLEEVIKLENLTSGLLQLANQENLRLQSATLSFKKILEESISSVKPKSEAKNITITSPKTKSFNFSGNHAAIVQALVILLDNAIKYSPENSEIKVDTTNSKNTIKITVSDQGPGINPDDMPYIFDRFYRADQSRTGNSGYGLGLPIAKQIIKSHGGEIKLSSKPGSGTTATISLPK